MSELLRYVGAAGKADFCACCGTLVPNTWSAPLGYVNVGELVYCDVACEREATQADRESRSGPLTPAN